MTSAQAVTDNIFVVDSYSTDRTQSILSDMGINFIEHEFVSYANKRNWAQENNPFKTPGEGNADQSFEDEVGQQIDKNKLFIFKSSERISSFLYFVSTVSFTAVIIFTLNILENISSINIPEDVAILITSTIVLIYSGFLYKITVEIFQHITLFYSLVFFLGSIGNLFLRNVEPWGIGLFITAVGLIWGLNTYSNLLQPSWLGYFLSSVNIAIGVIAITEDLLSDFKIINILILIVGSLIYIWTSIQLSEQVIFYIGGLGLIINLPRLITELLPNNIWPPLILFIVGGVLVTVGLYLNSIRENIRKES